jgi:DNA adenine methylase
MFDGRLQEGHTLGKLQVVPWSASPHPFLKWAGGKGQLLKRLGKYFPDSFSTYYEPFLGGGAVFFHLVQMRPKFTAVLSDVNEELITTYRVIKDNVEGLIEELEKHKIQYKQEPEKYYYQVRREEPADDVRKAARLIFLNKTCYNGLYRVNKKGKFNVPFGRYKNPKICDKENLRRVNQVLNWVNATILTADYREATADAKKGDFIYFDPPYQPISATANFTSYTHSGFSFEDQKALGQLFLKLNKRGCKILLSNSDTEKVWEIYQGFSIEKVPALRAINCKGNQRKGHTELIIHNRLD